MNLVNTSKNCSGQLGTERIPNTIFNFAFVGSFNFNGNAFFTINPFARHHVQGNKSIFFSTCNKHSVVAMRFNNDSFGATSTSSAASTTTSCASATSWSSPSSTATATVTTTAAATSSAGTDLQ